MGSFSYSPSILQSLTGLRWLISSSLVRSGRICTDQVRSLCFYFPEFLNIWWTVSELFSFNFIGLVLVVLPLSCSTTTCIRWKEVFHPCILATPRLRPQGLHFSSPTNRIQTNFCSCLSVFFCNSLDDIFQFSSKVSSRFRDSSSFHLWLWMKLVFWVDYFCLSALHSLCK